jgi:ADP-ribose pyrophosphatase YjhB (NUDIX family)
MAHIHEKIDFTASAFIVHDNKVLLVMHKKLGTWLQPGGHIELDEDPNEAVMREAKEETGLDITLIGPQLQNFGTKFNARELMPPRFLNRHNFNETHEHIDCVYFARSESGDAQSEEDGGEVRWFTKTELEENSFGVLPDVQKYALLALEELAS